MESQKSSSAKLIVITGGFGSGKSEFAINLALQLPDQPPRVLVDLDLVNTYFRSREACEVLEENNIKLICPSQQIAFSDLPIAGPGIREIISNLDYQVIIDVGGDDIGAIPLGSYQQGIAHTPHVFLLVVNPFRPFTSTKAGIIKMKEAIEAASGLYVTGIISNPHTGPATTWEQVKSRHPIVVDAAQEMGLPVLELMVLTDLYQEHESEFQAFDLPIRVVNIFLTSAWLLNQFKKEAIKNGSRNLS